MPTPHAVPPTASHDRLRVLLIDDHRVFTELLTMALLAGSEVGQVRVAASLGEGLAAARADTFDVAVVDIQLSDGNGLSVVRALREAQPNCRSIVLTAHPRTDLAERAIEAGAVAFLAKDGNLEDVIAALRSAHRGAPRVCTSLASASAPVVTLTPREYEVITLMAAGHTAASIAATLHLSIHTVRDHISSLLGKLDATSQLGAVAMAARLGLLPQTGM